MHIIFSLELVIFKIDWKGRTFEEKVIILSLLVGMLAWWAYDEYKIDNQDD